MGKALQRPVQPQTSEIDFSNLLKTLWRRAIWIALVTVVCAGLAILFVLTATPEYRAEAVVLVENQEGYLTNGRPESTTGPDESAMSSQASVVLSRDLARTAIRDLRLKGNPEFDPLAAPGGMLRGVFTMLRGDKSTRGAEPEDRMFENWYKALSASVMPKSRILSVTFTSRDPDLAAQAANKVADLYIASQANAKRSQAGAAAEALSLRVADLRTRLAGAQTRLESFRVSSGLLTGANNATLPSQQLAEINSQMAAARSAQADSQAKARLLREALRAGRYDEVPDIANNEFIRRISEQRVTIRTQLALESRTLGPEHPRTKELVAQLTSVDSELRGAIEKQARTLENDSRIAGSRVENLSAAIDKQRTLVGGSSNDEVRLRELTLETKLVQDQLEATTARWQEALSRQSSNAMPGDARVISRAVPPADPAFPKKTPTVLFGAVAGLIFSTFGVIAGALLSGSAYAPARATDGPVYAGYRPEDDPQPPSPLSPPPSPPGPGPGSGPEPRREPYIRGLGARASFVDPAPLRRPSGAPGAQAKAARDLVSGDTFESACEALAERLVRDARPGYGERVLVCEARADASRAALALGRALATKARTALIDMSGAPPIIEGDGLADLLAGRSSFGAVIERDAGSLLHVVGRGRGPMVVDAALDEALDAMCQAYDFVVLAIADTDAGLALDLAPALDRAIVVTQKLRDLDARALMDALAAEGAGQVEALGAARGLRRPEDAA